MFQNLPKLLIHPCEPFFEKTKRQQIEKVILGYQKLSECMGMELVEEAGLKEA